MIVLDFERYKRGLERRLNERIPLRDTSIAEAVREGDVRWQELFPSRPLDWPSSIHGQPVPPLVARQFPAQMAAKGLLFLEDGWVSAPQGWSFTRSGLRLLEMTPFGAVPHTAPRVRLPHAPFRRRVRRLRGRTLSLLSHWSTINFHHHLFDSLSRIHLLLAAGKTWSDIDHVLVPDFASPTAHRLLAATGIPEHQIVRVGRDQEVLFRAEQLVLPSFPGEGRTCSPESVAYLRGLRNFAGVETRAPWRRLFVRRRSFARLLTNESQLWEFLQSLGFESVDPAELEDTERTFSEAACVVSAHGAALANLVFCRPGTAVLELVPSDQTYPHFCSLSLHAGLRHAAIICPSQYVMERPMFEIYNSNADFSADLEVVRSSLQGLGFAS